MYTYYGIYFCGVTELSSVPLVAIDLFKTHRELQETWPILHVRSQEAFAAAFLMLRTIYWPIVSSVFWRATLRLTREEIGAHWPEVVFFCCINLFLTTLQGHWSLLILKALRKHISGDSGTSTQTKAATKIKSS